MRDNSNQSLPVMYTGTVTAYVFWLFTWIDQYIDTIQHFLATKIVLAPLLLLFLEEAGVPLIVPGDMIIAYTGYKLSINPHGPGLWQAFFAALLAALCGSSVLFLISRRWGQQIILQLGKFVFIKEKHIRQAEALFARWGILAIIIGRHIPGLRIPVTIFAATSGVKYITFLFSTFISTAAWIFFYLSAGKRLGASFHTEVQKYVGFTLGFIAAVTVGIILLHLVGMYRESRQKKRKRQTDTPSE